MNKEKLLKLLNNKKEQRQKLTKDAEGTEDVAELRSLHTQTIALDAEIRELQGIIDAIPDVQGVDPSAAGVAERTLALEPGTPMIVQSNARAELRSEEDTEYRKAFRDFVLAGTAIPKEVRANANTLTTDIGDAIPPVVMDRIIEKMDAIGMVLPLVTHTAYQSGLNIPTSSVKPVATWVAEGKGSDRQKKTTGVIKFGHNKLRCEISMSMEAGTMSLNAFETTFVNNISEAMVKARENAIFNGSGSGQPTGWLTVTPVTDQELETKKLDYKLICDAEAALPEQYESNAKWFMSKKTFMGFISMVDANEQPIARVNYGIGGKPERYLNGREVILVGDCLPSFDSAAVGKVFALICDMSQYVENVIYDMGIQRKQDWDTEDLLAKAVMATDGQPVDTNSLVTLKKKV